MSIAGGNEIAAVALIALEDVMSVRKGLSMIEHHRRLARRHTARLGRCEAEDLASEAMLRALRRPAPDGRAEPWLEEIARNLLADHWRRRARSEARMERLPAASPSLTPEDQLLAHERQHLLGAVLATLPAPLQAALQDRFFGETDDGAVADQRGLARTTVRTRIHRALGRLRRLVGDLRAVVPLPLGISAHPAALALVPAALTVLAAAPALKDPHALHPALEAAHMYVAQLGPARPRHPSGASSTSTREAAPSTTVTAPPPAPTTAAATPARKAPSPIATATAAKASPNAAAPPASAAVARFDFEDDDVAGEIQRPLGEQITGASQRVPHASLIEIPSSFVPAIAKMIDDL